jgi:hypothetical protein
MRVLAVALIGAALFGLGCPWPTSFEVEPGSNDTEPRIDRSRTEPMFEYSLSIPRPAEPAPELPVKLAVWEPDVDDVVKLRVFIDYDPDSPSPAVYERDITSGDALSSDPETWVINVQSIKPCTENTADNTVKIVDFVIASGWDSDLEEPEYRASLSGYTDEIRIKVTCLEPTS